MINVGVIGHSYLRPYLPGGSHQEKSLTKIVLTYYCQPGATFKSILSSVVLSDLIASSPDLIIVVLGGNDLVYGSKTGDIYSDLHHLNSILSANCSPSFGIHFLEPEKRIGDPKFVDPISYKALRNALVRKIKERKEVNLLPLIKFAVGTDNLKPDGVHLDHYGCSLFNTVLKTHISEILFNGVIASTEL